MPLMKNILIPFDHKAERKKDLIDATSQLHLLFWQEIVC